MARLSVPFMDIVSVPGCTLMNLIAGIVAYPRSFADDVPTPLTNAVPDALMTPDSAPEGPFLTTPNAITRPLAGIVTERLTLPEDAELESFRDAGNVLRSSFEELTALSAKMWLNYENLTTSIRSHPAVKAEAPFTYSISPLFIHSPTFPLDLCGSK